MKINKFSLGLLTLILFIAGCINLNFLVNNNIHSKEIIDNQYIEEIEAKNPKISGLWDFNGSRIRIDNNWTTTATNYLWCIGYGNKTHPYIIKGVFNCSSITIENSEVYFEVRKCVANYISLYNVKRGKLISNEASIRLTYSDLNLISGNQITFYNIWSESFGGNIPQYYVYSRMKLYDSHNNFIFGNIISDIGASYSIDEGGIYLEYSNGNYISQNSISECDFGVELYYSTENTINENECEATGDAIFLDGSSDNEIKENNLKDNLCGIRLLSSDDNNIENNEIENNERMGIYLKSSDDNIITDNDISDNERHGIKIDKSNKNIIEKNEIDDNEEYGIYLDEGDENKIKKNTISNNLDGVYLEKSDKNKIFKNTFIDNEQTCITEQDCKGNIIENNQCYDYINLILLSLIICIPIIIIIIIGLVLLKIRKVKFKGKNSID